MITLNLLDQTLIIDTTNEKAGRLLSYLERLTCPSCGKPDCCHDCDGGQGADENNQEMNVADRLKYNGFLDAIESIVLAHTIAGINVQGKDYLEGLETALQSAQQQFLE